MKFRWNASTFLVLTLILLVASMLGHYAYRKIHAGASLECEDCNVIVISLSNLRKKNMSFYGAPKRTTPNIDQYFKDSFSFDYAFAPASLTFTDATSFFYSLQPGKHKFMNRPDRHKSINAVRSHLSLPKILKSNGYSTAAFVSDEDYAYDNGYGTQFDFYFDKSHYADNGIEFRPWQYNVGTKDLIAPAVKWLRENKSNKFFLFLQAYDMHCPYTPSDESRKQIKRAFNSKIDFSACYMTLAPVEKVVKDKKEFYQLFDWAAFLNKRQAEPILFEQQDIDYLVELYDAELQDADANLAHFFQEIKDLNLEKNTVIIFMSEHGDYLGENGHFMKVAVTGKGNLHNANLGFPLMINYPPLQGPFKQKQLVQTIDLAPTILEMVGLPAPKSMQGKSFLKNLGNQSELNEYAYSFAVRKRNFLDSGRFIVQALQNREWKYNYFEHTDFSGKTIMLEENIFNLTKDPDELNDLSSNDKITLEFMRKKLQETRRSYER